MTDTQFKAQARADAIRAGYSPMLADWITSQLGKDVGSVLAGEESTSPQRRAPRALSARAAAPTGDRLALIAGCFGAQVLTAEFKSAGLSLRGVVAMLTEATGTARNISAAGIERVRLQLLQRKGAQ